MMRTCSPDREWAKAHALWHSGKIGPCVQREPTGRAIIVIVVEKRNREKREKEAEREKEKKRETHEMRERHEKRGTREEKEREGSTTFKTLPCERSKRSRVYLQTPFPI